MNSIWYRVQWMSSSGKQMWWKLCLCSVYQESLKTEFLWLVQKNGEFDAIVTAVEVLQKFSCGLFNVKHGESIINISIPNKHFHLPTSVYRKKTFTGLYTKWDSFTPRKYKINVMGTLPYWCFRICFTASLLKSAIDDLKRLFATKCLPSGHHHI